MEQLDSIIDTAKQFLTINDGSNLKIIVISLFVAWVILTLTGGGNINLDE